LRVQGYRDVLRHTIQLVLGVHIWNAKVIRDTVRGTAYNISPWTKEWQAGGMGQTAAQTFQLCFFKSR